MTLRLAINPLTWTNDDMPELGGDTPLETCLTEAKQAGYAGLELGNKFPRVAAALGPIMQEHGLDVVSLHTHNDRGTAVAAAELAVMAVADAAVVTVRLVEVPVDC